MMPEFEPKPFGGISRMPKQKHGLTSQASTSKSTALTSTSLHTGLQPLILDKGAEMMQYDEPTTV